MLNISTYKKNKASIFEGSDIQQSQEGIVRLSVGINVTLNGNKKQSSTVHMLKTFLRWIESKVWGTGVLLQDTSWSAIVYEIRL